MKKPMLGWIAAALLGIAPAMAAQRAGSFEAGVLGRYNWFDSHAGLDNTGGAGARLGVFVSRHFEFEAQGSYASTSLNGGGSVKYTPISVRLQYNIWEHSTGWVFGLGYSHHQFSKALDQGLSGLQGLAGFRLGATDFFSLRADVTLDYIPSGLNGSGAGSHVNWNPGIQLGLSLITGANPDADKDGVKDKSDRCPGTPRGESIDAEGCSASQRDSDHDGVSDNLDRCPDSPPGSPVDASGCLPDKDRDRVMDSADKCPDTPLGEPVDSDGCSASQRDSDGDGVMDGVDKCPNSPAGSTVDATGCNVVLFERGAKALILDGVTFETGKATLTPSSSDILDRVANSLQDYPDLTIEVGGHTDTTGPRAFNVKLSRARARAVMEYLVSRGIAATRMTTKGYGPDAPIADNNTADGRARNRRVELKKTSN